MRAYAITFQVDRTGEVSVSGNGAAGAPLGQYRGGGGQYRGEEGLRQPTKQPEERTKEPPVPEQRTQEPPVSFKDVLKNARTMQELAQVCPWTVWAILWEGCYCQYRSPD